MKKISFDFFSRKKIFTSDSLAATNLNRVLTLFDVTVIGIGFTLGSGIYILLGSIIRIYAGPATLISFIIAGIATFLSGLSYAELGSRVPRSGSAFVYIYVTIGEYFAFMMGWDLTLEYIIATAASSNALSQYIDNLAAKKISTFFATHLPMHLNGLSPYVDLLAFAIAIVVTSCCFFRF